MSVRDLVRHSRLAVAVWAGLIAATLASWWLGIDEGGHTGAGVSAATVAVIVIAFVKVRFVGRHFMALRDAPPVMALILDAYLVVVCTALLVIYLLTS